MCQHRHKAKSRRRLAEFRAEPLAKISALRRTLPLISVLAASIHFPHPLYHFSAHVADEFSFVPTFEIVEKKELFVLLPYRTDDVIFHYVRDEELREPFGINNLLTSLFHILRQIRDCLADGCIVFHGLEIRPSEAFVEIGILYRRLHAVFNRRIVFDLNEFTRHCSVGNIKESVKMQTMFFGRTLPDADIFPMLSVTHHFEASAQFSFERLLVVFAPVISKRAKIIELLQIDFAGKTHPTANQIAEFSFKLRIHIRFRTGAWR